MTNPTTHGQVPDALRLAAMLTADEWPGSVTLVSYAQECVAELRRQHARIAELEAQIEALSGVQALSAAPAVPAGACGYFSFSDECGFDRHDTADAAKAAATEMLADIRRELGGEEWPMNVESICWGVVVERAAEHETTTGEDGEKYCDYVLKGASPTPPAEQQAQPDECFPGEPKVAVPQGLIGAACFAIRNKRDGGKVLEQLRRYSVGDRSQPLAPQQAAPKAAPTRTALPEGWTDCTIEFGNDGPEVVAYGPKRMMNRLAKWLGKYFAQVIADAATKAAPGVGNSGFDHKTAADFLNGKTISDEAVRKFVAASRWAHDERAALSATLLAMHGVLASREAEIALLKKALLEAEAAPQQEAQEPALFVSAKQLASLADPSHATAGSYLPARKTRAGLFTMALYTAPQPAPAPLSEMPYEKRKAIQEGEQIGASDAWFKARHEMLDTVDRRNVFRAGFERGWNAALAAQGGK